LVLFSALRGFPRGTWVFPPPQKPSFDLIWLVLISIYSVPQKPSSSLEFTSSFVVEEISLTSTVSKLLLYHCSSQHWWIFATLLCWAVGDQACIFQKTQKLYRPWKAIHETPTRLFCKAQVFSYVVKGIKIKITAKFRDTEHLCFEDTKRIQEMGPWAETTRPTSSTCFGESRVSRSNKLSENLCKICMSQRWQTSKSWLMQFFPG